MKTKLLGLCLTMLTGLSLIGCGGHSHDFSTLITKEDAKCTETGIKAHYKCSCGKYFDVNHKEVTLEDLVIDALGHNYLDSWEIDTNASCTGAGSKHRDCTRCGKDGRETQSIEAVGHHMELVPQLDPTCTVAGHKAYYKCTRSDCSLVSRDEKGENVIPNLEAWLKNQGADGGYIAPTVSHVYKEVVADKFIKEPATCETATVYYKSCACGEKSSDTFTYGNPMGHDYGRLVQKVKKTCTEDGFDAHYYCERCHTYFTSNKVKTTFDALVIKKGHEVSHLDNVEATFEKDGHVEGYECSICNNHFHDAECTNPIAKSDWVKPKLQYEEDLSKTVYVDLSLGGGTGGLDPVDTGLTGYSYVEVDGKTPISWDTKSAGDEFTCYAIKNGSTSYKVSGLVATKVIHNGEEFLSTLNCAYDTTDIKDPIKIEGYFVIGNDITDLKANIAWYAPKDSQITSHNFKLVGTLDGRNHKLVSPSVTGSGGLFAARGFEGFTIKDLDIVDAAAGSYGLISYWADNLTLENVNISISSKATSAGGVFACGAQNLTLKNCSINTLAKPGQNIIAKNLISIKCENTSILKTYDSTAKLCGFTDAAGTVAYAGQFDNQISWIIDKSQYKFLEACEANFATPAHDDGYYCEECGKYFTDNNHEHEISEKDFFKGDKLPSTHVDNVQIFYNLATEKLDLAETPTVKESELVDAFKNKPSFTGMSAGTKTTLYTVGSTNYEYDVIAVTDVLDTETKFSEACNAKDHDISGYYVLTKNLTNQITCSPGGSHTNTTGVDITIDGRGKTITYLKGSGDTGGIFGTNQNASFFNVTFKNMKLTTYAGSYGLFGYAPANTNGSSLVFDNVDLTYSGSANYGTLGGVSSDRVVLRNSTIQFKAGQESYLFNQGVNPTFENSTIILDDSLDATKPQLVIKGHTITDERTGLESAISGLTFLNARP